MGRLVLILLVLTGCMASATAAECWGDRNNCLQEMRRLLTSENDFWFGNDFYAKCVKNGILDTTSQACMNPSPDRSIFARFLNTSVFDQSVVQGLQLANVEYNTPSGSYYGCGHKTYVPDTRYRLDPLQTATVNSWALQKTPSMTWNAMENTMYTVIVLDVGFLYEHGIYINCMEGNLDSCTPASPYTGPKNPRVTTNQFFFIVIEQIVYVDPATAGYAVFAIQMANDFRFYPTALMMGFPNTWGNPIAANIMSVQGDSYSMEVQKRWFIIDNCPLLASQEEAIYTVLNEAKIPAEWSYQMGGMSPRPPLLAERRPTLMNLTMVLNVEYDSDDLEIQSCCVETSVTRTLFRVNPWDGEPARPAVTRNQPRVVVSPINMRDLLAQTGGQLYTLMMVDMTDAAYKRTQNFNIHWLVTDMVNGDLKTGNERIKYLGPNPFDRYEPRVYVFLLLKQHKPMDDLNLGTYVSDQCPDFIYMRCGGNIPLMMRDWNLELAGVTWFISQQDAFARKRIYEEFYAKSVVDVCQGVEGFEWPCPDKHSTCDSSTNHATLTVPSLGLLVIASLLAFFRRI